MATHAGADILGTRARHTSAIAQTGQTRERMGGRSVDVKKLTKHLEFVRLNYGLTVYTTRDGYPEHVQPEELAQLLVAVSRCKKESDVPKALSGWRNWVKGRRQTPVALSETDTGRTRTNERGTSKGSGRLVGRVPRVAAPRKPKRIPRRVPRREE